MPNEIGKWTRAQLRRFIVLVSGEASGAGLDCVTCDGDDLTVAGDITLNEYIYHNGDADTYIRFAPNLVNLVAGGKSALKYEASTGKIILNNTNENVDVHIMAEDNTELLTTDAANNRVGIGTTAPEAYLDIKNIVDDGTTNRTMLRLHNYRSDDADVNDFGPISIDFEVENTDGGNKSGIARIAAVQSPVGTDHTTPSGEKSSGLIFSTTAGDTLAEAMRINASGSVGIGTTSPNTSLVDVQDYSTTTFENQLSAAEGGGHIIKYGTGTTVAGQLYFLHTDGSWDSTNAEAVASGASQLLGVALGTSPTTHGMLLRGYARIASSMVNGTAAIGSPVYVSETASEFDFTAPSSSGDFIRVVGYCIDTHSSDILLYLNPDPTWVEVT